MSRLNILTTDKAQTAIETLYKNLERRIAASPPGLCPIDVAVSYLKLSHSQSCGKCVPCRIGLGQLQQLFQDVLDGTATPATIGLIERTARSIALSADCVIGYEAADRILRSIDDFKEDFEEHILRGRCKCQLTQPVPCVALCPAGVDIPGYIALVSEGRAADTVRLIRKDNPMPAVCALICEHPCEDRCRRNMLDYPINVRGLKRFAVETAGDVPPPPCAPDTGKNVAIIGGGPGGLSAAYYLRLMGHGVTIFERRKKLGGMLRYGIPNYRLPRERLDSEINVILSTGVNVKTQISVGDDITIPDIKEQFDAVYIAIGAQTDKTLGIEGENARGVISAIEVFRNVGDDIMPDFTGKRVVVIGGGNVAMDAARTAVRCAAESVCVVYRRRRADMTALGEEIEGAAAEGCEIMELNVPLRIETDEDGAATALWVRPQIIGAIEGGRPKPADAEVDDVRIPCDIIIVATGQGIESKPFAEFGIPIKRGVIDALSWSGIEALPGVFAGGDCVTGPATVIRAIAAGKVAAANIDEYLGFNHEITTDVRVPNPSLDDRYAIGRVNMRERGAAERVCGFEPIELGMTWQEASQEAKRCLRCDHFGYGVFKGGRNDKW